MMHISTDDTFFIDSLISEKESECPVCHRMSKVESGYIGFRHQCCKIVLDEEEWAGRLAMKSREYLGMTRRQLGEKLGYAVSTIHHYEYIKISKKYIKALKAFVLKYNEEKEDELVQKKEKK